MKLNCDEPLSNVAFKFNLHHYTEGVMPIYRVEPAKSDRSQCKYAYCFFATAILNDGRGLHSSTFQLNLSAFCGIGDAFRDCLGGVLGVRGDIRGQFGRLLCQKRLRLS